MATNPPNSTPTASLEQDVDVLVIGGGLAGLSAALTLARSRRSVLVVDAGQPRNAPAAGVHAFLTRDGIPPARLRELGQAAAQGNQVRAVVNADLVGEDLGAAEVAA